MGFLYFSFSPVVASATWHVQLVEDAVGIRTYGDEKIASIITAIRVLSKLSVANGSRSRGKNTIALAPENLGNGVVLFVTRTGYNLKYSISIQGEIFFCARLFEMELLRSF